MIPSNDCNEDHLQGIARDSSPRLSGSCSVRNRKAEKPLVSRPGSHLPPPSQRLIDKLGSEKTRQEQSVAEKHRAMKVEILSLWLGLEAG